MATQSRAPTGDGTVTGTVSGSVGNRYTLVDDYPNTSSADALTFGTAAATISFTYSAFTVPAGSTGISVQVRYVDGEAANGNNNCGGRLIVGGANRNASTHNPSGTGGTLREDNWATNPSSGAAWTVDEVNGTAGSHALTGFGINSTDSNPTFWVASIEIQVTYSPPASATVAATLAELTSSVAAQVEVQAQVDATLAGLTSAASATVEDAGASASVDATLGTMTSSAQATALASAQAASTLGAMTSSAAATVTDPPEERTATVSATLGSLSSAATATVTAQEEDVYLITIEVSCDADETEGTVRQLLTEGGPLTGLSELFRRYSRAGLPGSLTITIGSAAAKQWPKGRA